MDFPKIALLALSHAEQICAELFPLGQKRGREFVVGDIYGNRGESLSINLTTGIFKDFSNGSTKGGDLTALVAAAKNVSQYDAAEWIEGRYDNGATHKTQQKIEEFNAIFPVTEHAPDSAFKHYELGEPTAVYCYNNRQGQLLNYVCRFDPPNAGKEYRALTYGVWRSREGWHWKQMPVPRPLYQLEKLPESGQIIIVEGEKSAEALSALLPDICVLTWQAGTNNATSADWSPLYNKEYDVLFWPDNDEPGKEAMQNIASILRGRVGSMGVLDVSELPEKSDAADWDKTVYELREFLISKRKAVRNSISSITVPTSDDGEIDPTTIPGLIGDTVRWIVSTSDQPRPDMALYNTLAFAGAVFGRKYEVTSRRTRTNIYIVGTGETGCHAKGTKIMMFDGSFKEVEKIRIGEKLMGPDSTPRHVTHLHRGREEMFKITPTKGEAFVVNFNHILSLYRTNQNKPFRDNKPRITNIPVCEYLKKHKTFKHMNKLRRVAIDFLAVEKPTIDPWFLGALLGDGTFLKGGPALTSADREISDAAIKYADDLGIKTKTRKLRQPNKASAYYFTHGIHHVPQHENILRTKLMALNLWGKKSEFKFIPNEYKCGSEETRLQILAGLIDTDGSLSGGGYDFISKSETLSKDVQFICRSLGLAAYVSKQKKHCQNNFSAYYWRVSISGDISIIPVKCSRKKAAQRKQIKNPLYTGFSIESEGDGDFYGFSLDGDHLYLTSDFIVHHNSGKNHPRQALTRLATLAGLSMYIGGNSLRSDTGMLRGLANTGSQVLMLDEFGQLLKSINDPKQIHLKNTMRTLLTLYSDSNSVYHHGDYADPKNKPIIIHSPNLCIYGTTTESEYIPALRKSSISSGELNRFIVLPMDSKKLYPLRASPSQNIPEDLVEAWRKFSPGVSKNIGIIVNTDTVLPDPIQVSWGECEDLQYRLRCEQEDIRCGNSPTRHLWGRLHENVTKVALILAIGRGDENLSIMSNEFKIADSLVRQSIAYMESLAENYMSENDYEAVANDVVACIKSAKGDGIGRSALMKRFRKMKKRDIDEILSSLIEQEAIIIMPQESTGGRKKTVYKIS
jgi:hypothetical protein